MTYNNADQCTKHYAVVKMNHDTLLPSSKHLSLSNYCLNKSRGACIVIKCSDSLVAINRGVYVGVGVYAHAQKVFVCPV